MMLFAAAMETWDPHTSTDAAHAGVSITQHLGEEHGERGRGRVVSGFKTAHVEGRGGRCGIHSYASFQDFFFFFKSNRCTKLKKKKDQIFPPYHSNLFLFLSLVCCLSSLPVHIPPPHCPIQSTSPLPFMISLTHTGPITAPPPLALPPTICSPPRTPTPTPPVCKEIHCARCAHPNIARLDTGNRTFAYTFPYI